VYILVTYVPDSHLEVVKEAIFKAGAGTMGSYDSCCFQSQGTGQFRPLQGSSPFIGQVGELAQAMEWRLELVVDDECAAQVVDALLESHPYEVPAYHLIPVLTLEGLSDE